MFENDSCDLISINSIEQIRRFLNDDRSFFDSTFLESVANVIFAKSIGYNEVFRDMIKENIITFGTLCLKYSKLQKKYSSMGDFDIVDEGLMETAVALADEFLTLDKNYTAQLIYEKFKSVMNTSERRMLLESDIELEEKFKRYISIKECKVEDSKDLQKFLEVKIETISVIEQIETFSQFVSKQANECNSITEFVQGFVETINNISTSLTDSSDINTDNISLSEVVSGKVLAEITQNETTSVKCGIPILDAIMGSNGGFDRGRIYVFGGQTGGGKSTVLLNILYGMLKQLNGVFFSEVDIYGKENQSANSSIQVMKKFVENHILNHKNEKKKLILYYTLENTKEETVKRLMCRMGLLPHTFWLMIERDKSLSKLFKEKGYAFQYSDLPDDMPENLKQRIFNYSQFMNIVCNENQIADVEIIWHAPYSISSYDILLDCKRYQRKGKDIEAIFVDYPDKMRAIDATKNDGDQNWLELGKIIDNLKALAKHIDVPVITVTQLNKEGNKATSASKLGSSSGSMMKEYNSDTQVNMNFNSSGENSMSKYFQEFKNQQKHISLVKETMFSNMVMSNGDDLSSVSASYNFITRDASRSSDIIRMKVGMPSIQTVDSYITKNRDSVAKMEFSMNIVYGMYLVTDYETEAYNASRYSVETYMMIANYMYDHKHISQDAYKICVENETEFIHFYNDYARSHNIKNLMNTLARRPERAKVIGNEDSAMVVTEAINKINAEKLNENKKETLKLPPKLLTKKKFAWDDNNKKKG